MAPKACNARTDMQKWKEQSIYGIRSPTGACLQMPHLGRRLHSLAAQGPLRDHIDGCHDPKARAGLQFHFLPSFRVANRHRLASCCLDHSVRASLQSAS